MACASDSPSAATEPTPGALTLSLVTPNPDDGAVLIALTGSGIDSLAAVGLAARSVASGQGLRVILHGVVRQGVVARVHVRDTRRASEYVAVLEQVVSRANYAQRALAGYSVTVTR